MLFKSYLNVIITIFVFTAVCYLNVIKILFKRHLNVYKFYI